MSKKKGLDEQYYEELRKSLRSLKLPEPAYEDYRWTEENLHKYIESVAAERSPEVQKQIQDKGCKMFFVAKTGNVLQNDFLIAAVVWYKKCGFLTKETIDKLLSYEKPIFRVEVMVETNPRSCIFRKKTFDLVELAIERKDKELLKFF